MSLEGEQGIVAIHPAAVVGDADQLAPSGLHFNPDAVGSGVEGVLQQFLDHRGRPVDDLARSDLVT